MWMHFSGAAGRGSRSNSKLSIRRRRAVIGSLMAVARSGAIGALTIAGWLAILTCGPVAAVKLWRFRRMGLTLAAMLCAIAVAYLLIGLLFLRTAETPLLPIVEGLLVNALLLGFLLSPSARRACVE